MKSNDKIAHTQLNVSLVDAYWYLVEAFEEDKEIPIDKILVLGQYMLTAYLSTVPEMTDVQVQVLELLRKILPDSPLPDA